MRHLVLDLIALVCLSACATTRADSVGQGDSRIDDASKAEAIEARARAGCGADGLGDVVLLDARTAGPLTCTEVTLSREPAGCLEHCPSTELFKGFTNAKGLVSVGQVKKVRLVAVAEGFAPSALEHASSVAGRPLELEMAPESGFWLKVVDGDGNYLSDVVVTFKQGGEVIAQKRTNELANVFFGERTPFGGDPFVAEVQGFPARTVGSQRELGDDGHTLTVSR